MKEEEKLRPHSKRNKRGITTITREEVEDLKDEIRS